MYEFSHSQGQKRQSRSEPLVALCPLYLQKRTKVQALAAMLVEIGLRAQMFLSSDYEEFIGAKKHLVWGLLAHNG
jgi:hypothetical protein